ncbi:MAG: AAA domain-containing protein, partial [bacterium]|nr:AAA domain-containing protein [bacterium]
MSKQVYNQEEVPLTGILSEFRTALREEIEAARRNESSSAVSLINGRRIAQVGGNYQYLFDLENVLNVPGDMPGDLYVEGHAPLNVTIVSVYGMAVTLSVPEDLGKFVPTARLRSNLAYLMSKLIERIEVLANKANPVGERIRGALPVSGELALISQSEEQDLNTEQNNAVASSLGFDTTFIFGPPGTGKTQTIGAIGKQLYCQGRSVLVVSHTNIAVDQATLRIGKLLAKFAPDDIANGCILRVGDYKDPSFEKYPDLLLKTHVARKSEELAKRRDARKTELGIEIEKVKDISRKIDICEWIGEAKVDIPIMNQELENIQKLEQELNEKKTEQLQLSKESAKWDADTEAAQHTKNLLDEIIELDELIVQINHRIKITKDKLIEIGEKLAQNLSNEIAKLNELITKDNHFIKITKDKFVEIGEELAQNLSNEIAKLNELIVQINYSIKITNDKLVEIGEKLTQAKLLYEEIISMGWITRQWRRLPSPESQFDLIKKLQTEIKTISLELEEAQNNLIQTENKRTMFTERAETLAQKLSEGHASVELLARQWQQSTSSENQSELIQKFYTEIGEISLELEEAQNNLIQTENKRTMFTERAETLAQKLSEGHASVEL